MKTHYYLGWFSNFIPEDLARVLQEDITDTKSIAMISSNPAIYEEEGATERSWLDVAGIAFDEYDLINYQVQKGDAQALIQKASVIFLLGGNPVKQNEFLMEYELSEPIKQSNAVVMGASAGAINMAAKWLCSKKLGFEVETSSLIEGVGLDDFSVLSHYDLENNTDLVLSELSPLSQEMDIYASNKDCAIRVKGDQIDIYGNVYVISNSVILKLDETLNL
ncbi:Type 1 glutamine amidotransferase-like domain-containing protein [Bacillus sp. RO1]|uniref:Type 1 glutamine amidotransferase-like domain-containing protein n=1 Tax=Bacillus sp. RO1 TaxID=2722703 RepID=UPI0014566676|nr:Type 1 glutamine amidotransferase-like domain-containing protein [Bacillus sp. RO1]NLP52455.1 type 1 glutamine amidotransferase-like domain-containing protein [Bacillus sp. RO1]